jgi:hypothetical protein
MTALPSSARINRFLVWLALLATVLGVLLGQALVTWFNAALL